jgi:hypothetical protein
LKWLFTWCHIIRRDKATLVTIIAVSRSNSEDMQAFGKEKNLVVKDWIHWSRLLLSVYSLCSKAIFAGLTYQFAMYYMMKWSAVSMP